MKNPFRVTRIFWSEMLSELKKATWPTRKELKDLTIVVLIGIMIVGTYVTLVDFSLFQVVSLFSGWAKNGISF